VAGQRSVRGLRPLRWSLLFLAALVGACTAYEAPREIGRWHLAAALNVRGTGEKDAAYQKLAAAIAWFPKSPALLLQRAEWRLDDGERDEAFADCDRMLEVGGDRQEWLRAHAQFLQNAGEFGRAVEDWKKINELSQRSGTPSRPDALNGLAYAQSLAEVELDEALENVNQALELQTTNNDAILDTRGYIFHLKDQNIMALSDLDRAVKGLDPYVKPAREELAKEKAQPAEEDKLTTSQPKTLVEIQSHLGTRADQLAGVVRSAAVIHYHRALILAALDRQQEADAERAFVRQLIGREPDATLF